MYKWINEFTFDDILEHSTGLEKIGVGIGNNRHYYLQQYCGFDIETTQYITKDYAHAYMYIWSFTYNDITILGSYWEEFLELLEMFEHVFDLDERNQLLIFIANMGFEFQFMRKWLNVTDSFFVDERKPLYIIHDKKIEFRDALQISGGKLEDLARNYTQTQKMVGDLDYNIMRNHSDAKRLTEKELQYVLNDTIILAEYMKYYFDTFTKMKFLPLTKTGILRKRVKKKAVSACKKAGHKLSNIITALHPSYNLYTLMMKWLFRGGYVHGANCYAGIVLENATGADITSSYPNEMNTKDNYPVSKFYRVKDITNELYLDLNKNYATMAVINFYGVKTKTAHSIESESKVIQSRKLRIDNGRVLEAEFMQVFITELDFDIYQKFYKWEKMEVKHCWKAKRGRLPRYLLDIVNEYYQKKSELKKAGKKDTTDYALSKEMVNSGYGLTVTRMRENTIIYDNDKDEYTTDNSFVFEKEVAKQALLPQWGIWITANARHTLLDMVYNIEMNAKKLGRDCDCAYEDTDSIKILNYIDHRHIIEEYNRQQDLKIREICDKFGYSYEFMKGLGNFDIEYPYIKRFKHNGAKRYALKFYDFEEKQYKTISTISGLSKKALTAYCEKNHLSIWKVFVHGMNIPVEETGKLASIYNDDCHSDIINGELMEEQSSICLTPVEFTMTLDANYRNIISELEKRIRTKML